MHCTGYYLIISDWAKEPPTLEVYHHHSKKITQTDTDRIIKVIKPSKSTHYAKWQITT